MTEKITVLRPRPRPQAYPNKGWTCGCGWQLWFITQEGLCICENCHCASNTIQVIWKPSEPVT